jgi:hypothetical protein
VKSTADQGLFRRSDGGSRPMRELKWRNRVISRVANFCLPATSIFAGGRPPPSSRACPHLSMLPL